MVTISGVEVHVVDANPVSENKTTTPSIANKPEPQDQDRGKRNNKSDNSTVTATSTTNNTATGVVTSIGADAGDSGWITLPLSGPTTFDLLALKTLAADGGITQLLGGADLPAGTYTQIRLEVKSISVTIGNNTPQSASVPSGKIKFVQPFEIMAGQTTGLVFDFDAAQSLNVTSDGKVMFKPVIKLSLAKPQATAAPLAITFPPTTTVPPATTVLPATTIPLTTSVPPLTIVLATTTAPSTTTVPLLTTIPLATPVTSSNSTNISVDESFNGKEVKMAPGDSLQVALQSNITTGFKWELTQDSDTMVLEKVSNTYETTQVERKEGERPLVGVGGKEFWNFKALKKGNSLLSMEYSRPWEGGEKGVNKFSLTVIVE